MYYKIFFLFAIFVIIFSCELPHDADLDFDDYNYISGLSSPKKTITKGDDLYILDRDRGIYKLDLTSLSSFSNMRGEKFSPGNTIIKPVFSPNDNLRSANLMPYDVTDDSSFYLKPVDFDINQNTGIVYVLSTIESISGSRGSYIDSNYYIYTFDTAEADVNAAFDPENDMYPLDSYPVSADDSVIDIGNTATHITVSDGALYLTIEEGVRTIMLAVDGSFDASMDFDVNGTRSKLQTKGIESPKKIACNGYSVYQINTYEDKLGFNVFSQQNTTVNPDKKSLVSTTLPYDLHVDGNNMYMSTLFAIEKYDISGNGTAKKTKTYEIDEDKVALCTTSYSDRLAVAYGYQVEYDQFADYQFIIRALYSGVRIYSKSNFSEKKDIVIDDWINQISIYKDSYVISLSLTTKNIYIHKL